MFYILGILAVVTSVRDSPILVPVATGDITDVIATLPPKPETSAPLTTCCAPAFTTVAPVTIEYSSKPTFAPATVGTSGPGLTAVLNSQTTPPPTDSSDIAAKIASEAAAVSG